MTHLSWSRVKMLTQQSTHESSTTLQGDQGATSLRPRLRPPPSRRSISKWTGPAVARCRSAAARLTSLWAVRRTSASTSIRMVPRGLSVHGGRGIWSLTSTGVSSTPAREAAPLPMSRQQVVVRRRRRAVLITTARRGPILLCDAAVHTSLAARTFLRVRTGIIPASAISGFLGELTGQPVTTRAAARHAADSRAPRIT